MFKDRLGYTARKLTRRRRYIVCRIRTFKHTMKYLERRITERKTLNNKERKKINVFDVVELYVFLFMFYVSLFSSV